MYVKDLAGNEYVTMMTYTVTHELNGHKELNATLLPNRPNLAFLEDLEHMWTLVDDEDTKWRIIYVKNKGEGNTKTSEIKAIPLFYDDFSQGRVYERYSGSMTAVRALDIIFGNSGYNYVLNGDYTASEFDSFGDGSTRLELFQTWLNRYGGEFLPPIGNTVYINNRVGEDLSVQYRHRLNASNIVMETDAENLWTYAIGYADYEGDKEAGDWQDAKLIREYTSPLSNLLGIRHAPPIKDGRIRHASVLDRNLKTLVDDSLKISVTADIHDLRKQGYPIGQTSPGDRVFLIDERIKFNEEVRVVKQEVTRDWRGEILDVKLTFGSQDIVRRYQSKMNQAAKNISDILEGRKKLPMNALNNEVAQVTKALLSAQTELDFENGIIARDPNNPNLVVVLNSAGLGISQDGGNTFKNAITGRGILAEHILAGTITAGGNRRIDISDGSIWSYVGDKLTMSFGRYQMDFYHPDGTLVGHFGPGNIVDTDIPGLRLLLDRDGYFTIGHNVDGIARPTYRTYSYGGYHYTMMAGPWSDSSRVSVYASAKVWDSSTDEPGWNQSAMHLFHNSSGRNNDAEIRYGSSGDDSEFRIIYNGRDSGLIRGTFDEEGFRSPTINTSNLNVGNNVKIRSSSNAARIGPTESTYLFVNDSGRVGLSVAGNVTWIV